MIVWGWVALMWATSVAAWTLVACARERPSNYHAFCELLGLCVFWPLTLFLEIALRLAHARRSRAARKTTQEN